jgi:hypothetical protein
MTEQPNPSESKKTRYSFGVYLVAFVFLLIALFERVTGYVPPSRLSFSHLRRVNAGEVKTDLIIAAALFGLGVVVGFFEWIRAKDVRS